MTQGEIALVVAFVALAGVVITNFVNSVLHFRSTRIATLESKRKSAVAFYAAIAECLDDLRLGGDGRKVPINYDIYSSFLLSLPKSKRTWVESQWNYYIISKTKPEFTQCSLEGLKHCVHEQT